MNKRIEDLLGQAYDEAVPETWTTLSSEQLGRIYEKFAELLITECKENFAKVWYEQGMDIRGGEIIKFLNRFDEYLGVEE